MPDVSFVGVHVSLRKGFDLHFFEIVLIMMLKVASIGPGQFLRCGINNSVSSFNYQKQTSRNTSTGIRVSPLITLPSEKWVMMVPQLWLQHCRVANWPN